ncbi:MAG TPA: hypothetical protein VNX02_12155 [Steroidobacteraceae bacterium]|nr:hypothetical protein [Steroidobacteraceae bacterium]
MNVRSLVRTVGALLLGVAVAGAPALSYAQHSVGGGGGGHASGGGHFGGGGHFSGGHFAGGGHAVGHFVGGGAHYAGGHYVSHAGYAGGAAGAHFYGGAAPHYGAGFAAGRFAGGHVFYPGRGGFYPGRFWGGGYWHGTYWPHCYFYPGFAWFLPVLPFGYATFWWGGAPYYYANDLYYTYSPADNGYVVTEPPPSAGDESSPPPAGGAEGDNGAAYAAPANPNAAVQGNGSGEVYLYPRNGQSDQQMSNDRYECHSWAAGQTGFDPTRGGDQSGGADAYRRAMIACLDARGYSAR